MYGFGYRHSPEYNKDREAMVGMKHDQEIQKNYCQRLDRYMLLFLGYEA